MTLVKQKSAMPTRKVTAFTISGLLAAVAVPLVVARVPMLAPVATELEPLMTVLVATAAGYMTKERA